MNKEEALVGDSDGLRVTNYPITAAYVARRMSKDVVLPEILEVCCGVGGTTIELAKVFKKVYAVDINKGRLAFAKKNIERAGLSSKVNFFASDIFCEELLKKLKKLEIGAIFIDVEWTTTGIYGQDHASNIESTNPNTLKLFKYLKDHFSKDICMRLPKNINFSQLRKLGNCEIETIYKNDNPKFVYVYYGRLRRVSSSKQFFTFD